MEMPIGTIIAWNETIIPDGWAVCDGNSGTPNLIDRFVLGAVDNADRRETGGTASHAHSNPNTSTRDNHNHGGTKTLGVSGGGTQMATSGSGRTDASPSHTHSGYITTGYGGSHSHTTGNTNSVNAEPSHILRIFIKRIS